MTKKYAAEFIGTFGLVFAGTGAIIIDQQTQGGIGHIGIAITFGLIILTMIYAFGSTSGAHFNPAVTLGLTLAKRFEGKQVAPYILSQVGGAFFATFILKYLFPENVMLGTTIPAGSDMQAFVLECILTYFLMIVIINVTQTSNGTGALAGIAIGATIMLDAMFGGPITGASMNPARSLAPALISGNLQSLWVYILAPITGALLAALTWMTMSKDSN
jgi:aquaporin NIP